MPKTIKNQFDTYLTYDKLMEAHMKCQKGKKNRANVIKFNLKKEEYIQWLYEQIKTKRYQHGKYISFYVWEPKKRKIEAARYIDRIVHRWLVDNFLEPAFLPQLIDTTYACIKNRGIDKDILMEIIKKKIVDKDVLWLINQTLYGGRNEPGIPIGNLSSQLFANLYYNEADQFIKHTLKVKYYFRYMDDSVILLKDKQELKKVRYAIENFIKEKLKLEFNSKTNIFKSKQGVNFCGYKINEYRMKLRDKGKRKLKNKVKSLKNKIKNGEITSKEAKKYLCGHFGYIKYANTYHLIHKIFVCD